MEFSCWTLTGGELSVTHCFCSVLASATLDAQWTQWTPGRRLGRLGIWPTLGPMWDLLKPLEFNVTKDVKKFKVQVRWYATAKPCLIIFGFLLDEVADTCHERHIPHNQASLSRPAMRVQHHPYLRPAPGQLGGWLFNNIQEQYLLYYIIHIIHSHHVSHHFHVCCLQEALQWQFLVGNMFQLQL